MVLGNIFTKRTLLIGAGYYNLSSVKVIIREVDLGCFTFIWQDGANTTKDSNVAFELLDFVVELTAKRFFCSRNRR